MFTTNNSQLISLKLEHTSVETPTFAYPYNNRNYQHQSFANIDEIKDWLAKEVTPNLICRSLAANEMEQVLKNELAFLDKISASMDLWQAKDIKTILWDIDDTMGSFVGSRVWYFRPTMLPLMTMLKENFYELQHGILTARASEAFAKEDGATMKILNSVGWFWNREHFYSSREAVSLSEAERFVVQNPALLKVDLSEIVAKKILAAQQLAAAGLKFAWIDDFNVGSFFEPGVFTHVGNCSPEDGLKAIYEATKYQSRK